MEVEPPELPVELPVLAKWLRVPDRDLDFDSVGWVARACLPLEVGVPVCLWRRRAMRAVRLRTFLSARASLTRERLTACRSARQWPGRARRHLLNLRELCARARRSAARAARAPCRAVLLIMAVGWVVLAAAPALIANKVRHVTTSSVVICRAHARWGRGWDVNMLLLSFGSWAVCLRPLALRARLATGVPLSGTCEGALGGPAPLPLKSCKNEELQETFRRYASRSLAGGGFLDASGEVHAGCGRRSVESAGLSGRAPAQARISASSASIE